MRSDKCIGVVWSHDVSRERRGSDLWALLRDKRRRCIAHKARCPAFEQRVGLCVVQPSSTSAALALPKKQSFGGIGDCLILNGPCGDTRSPVRAGVLPKQGAPPRRKITSGAIEGMCWRMRSSVSRPSAISSGVGESLSSPLANGGTS